MQLNIRMRMEIYGLECIKRGEEIIFLDENETESIDEKEIPKLCDAFYRIR